MPITQSITRSSVLTDLSFDMIAGVGTAVVRHTIPGIEPQVVRYTVDGAKFAELLSTPGQAGVSLADQVTNAVYAYLTTAGLVDGTIS